MLCCQSTYNSLQCQRALECCVQERLVLDAIQQYFQHEVPEVTYDDEDAFVDVLQKAGLTDG